jgi:hypothetical protein
MGKPARYKNCIDPRYSHASDMAVLGRHFCFHAERAEEISFLKAQNFLSARE